MKDNLPHPLLQGGEFPQITNKAAFDKLRQRYNFFWKSPN
jgi:hypothetical protein